MKIIKVEPYGSTTWFVNEVERKSFLDSDPEIKRLGVVNYPGQHGTFWYHAVVATESVEDQYSQDFAELDEAVAWLTKERSS